MLAIDCLIHCPHIIRSNFSLKRVKRSLNLWPTFKRVFTDEWNRLIGRKVVLVVFKRRKPERLNGAVGRVGSDHVNLMSIERSVEQAEVHSTRRGGEFQPVGLTQAGQAIRALLKFISDSQAPLGRVWRGLAQCGQMEGARVFATNDHGKSIFE